MPPVTIAFSSLPPPPSACVCPTTPHALFLPTLHPCYGWWGPIEQLQAPSGEFPLFGPLFANNPPPSPHASLPALVNTHQGKARVLFPPHAMLAASTRPCTPCFKPHQPPHCKCNPQINPAPRINHPHQRNQPTKMPQQMESSTKAHQWGPSATWQTTGDTAPTMQPGAYPVLPH